MNKLTEAEKGKVIDYLLNQNNGSYKDLAEDSFDEGYSLSRKQVIEKIEEWVNEKDFEQPFNNSASISVFDLITFLNNLKK